MAEDKNIQWHPIFVEAMKEYLSEYDDLTIIPEYNLSQEPLRIDILIKNNDEVVENDIGKFFRMYNIIEYKNPFDSVNVDDFYKVLAYSYLYKSLRDDKKYIDIKDLTISIFCSSKPKSLIKYLSDVEELDINLVNKGIYYVEGLTVPLQIINLTDISGDNKEYLLKVFSKRNDDLKIAVKKLMLDKNVKSKEALLDLVDRRNKYIIKEAYDDMKNNITPDERRSLIDKYLKDDKEMIETDTLLEMSIKLLTMKFGTLSKEIKDKLQSSDKVSLELVIQKLVTSNSIDEVISHLK